IGRTYSTPSHGAQFRRTRRWRDDRRHHPAADRQARLMAMAASIGHQAALEHDAAALAAPLPPLLVEAERVAATVAQGVHGRRRVGTGETFWQFRRYQFGDDAARIDWRQSAKSDALYVRENEWDAAESVWLWCDASLSMDYQSSFASVSKRDRARLILIAL